MGRTLTGAMTGLVICGAAVATVSLLSEQPAGNTPPAPPQTEVEAVSDIPAVDIRRTPTNPDTGLAIDIAPPTVPVPASDAGEQPVTETAPLAKPQLVQAAEAGESPILSAIPEIVTDPDAELDPDHGQIAQSEPAQQEVPPAQPAPTVPTPEVMSDGVVPLAAAVEEDAPNATVVLADVLAADATPATAAPTRADEPLIDNLSGVEGTNATAVATSTSRLADTTAQEPARRVVSAPAAEVQVIETSDIVQESLAVIALVDSLDLADGAVSGPGDERGADTEDGPPPPALLLYSAIYDGPADAPKLSILLADNRDAADLADVLPALGFAPVVVMDPTDPGARRKAFAYQNAGAEIAISLPLPAGATDSDLLTVMEDALRRLPQAIAVFFDGTGPLQQDKDLGPTLMGALASEGMGFVAIQQGFGTILRVAEEFDVPATQITRNALVSAGEDFALRRALDQGALRARQAGEAVVLMPFTESVLDLLEDWQKDLRGDQLKLAPLSYVLAPELFTAAEQTEAAETAEASQ